MNSGSLLIDKRVGVTSREEVNFLSKKLGIKKAGHIGTLDPFADGLLIVLFGSSTKISPFLETMDKEYIATLSLGKKTNSGDLTGEVIIEKDVPVLSNERINEVFQSFKGKQNQLPPLLSAIKVNGKPLYKYARSGEEITRKEREIEIYSLDLISFSNNEIVFKAHVSKGTYIRTLGEDIAERLGTVGHLVKLTRTKIGNYSLKDAKSVDEVSEDDFVPILKMLSHIKTITVDKDIAKKALNGVALKFDSKDDLLLIKDIDDVIAIYKKQSNGVYSCLRGLR